MAGEIVGSYGYQLSDGTNVYRSACRMCHGGCGVLVHVKEGKVAKIVGDPDFPLNNGKICPKGALSIEHLYNPDRLKYPLKRVGKRGEGKWERISWGEALETVAEQFNEIKSEYGAEAIAILTGTGRHHVNHVTRFANALGTPNWAGSGLAQCFLPRILASVMTYGDLPVCDYYGDVNPQCVLVWGHNPAISGPDGEIQFKVRECLEKGTKLMVVDPRRTELADKADIWLQLRPGTDDALALSMIHVIIEEGLYDKEFVENWTVGFEPLAERVKACTPEWAEEITWVPADKIRAAAREFANTKPATLEWGVAIEHTPNCFQTVRAVGLLPALTGNIDIPGGWILGMHIVQEFPVYLLEEIPYEMSGKRLGADRFKVLSGRESFFPTGHSPSIFEAMITGKPYPVKAALVSGNNTLVTYGNTKRVYEALTNLDFMVVMEIYMTPTAELADIILPVGTWLEVDEVVGLPFVASSFALAQQKIVSMWECRPDEEIFVELARKMNLDAGVEPVEDIYDKQLMALGITFEELKEKGFVTVPMKYRKYEENDFVTSSGKVELYSSMMENLGYDPLPHYEEPPESPISAPDVAKEFPLILTTGARSQYFFASEFRQIPSLRKRHPDPLVEIHPQTADELDIQEGDWVWIETRRGRIQQRAKLTDGIDPTVVHVEYGWWFPEEPGPEHGVWKANANVLTDNGPPYDPAMGTYQLRALLCKVYKE